MPETKTQRMSVEVAELTFQLLVYCQVKEASMAAECGRTPSEIRVLRLFGDRRVVHQRDLHDRVGLSGSRLTRIVDSLVAAGLLVREIDPSDRRGMVLRLTSSGRKLVAEVHRRSAEMHGEILQSVPTERRGQIVGGLRDLLKSVAAWMPNARTEAAGHHPSGEEP